jgi:hypothetical protein
MSVVHMEEHLFSTCEALGSVHNTTNKMQSINQEL